MAATDRAATGHPVTATVRLVNLEDRRVEMLADFAESRLASGPGQFSAADR